MIKLTPREKRLVQIMGVFFAILVLFYGIINPIMNLKQSIDEKYETNIQRLNEMDAVYKQFREIKEKREKMDQLLRDTRSVSTLVEDNARKANIINNKAYNRDNESNIQNKFKKITTDVKFEGVNIKGVMDFLYYMENSNKLIKVSYFRINEALKERNNYDVTIKFESYKID